MSGPLNSDTIRAGAAGASGGAGYQIDQSIRFNSADTAKLTRTFGTATNRKIFTFSVWVKNGNSPGSIIEYNGTGGVTWANIQFGGNRIDYFDYSGGSARIDLRSTAVFRDPSAWYHLVVAMDTTQSTASNRLKFYINGTQITTFGTSTYPSLNLEGFINSAVSHLIGKGTNGPFDGYLAEYHFVDGQALAPTDFAEYNDNGVWIPKEYNGSYGNNGFYITGETASDLGEDFSGNNNDFTSSGLTAADQMGDTPTNNFWTLNPTDPHGSNIDISEGNLRADCTSSATGSVFAPMLPETGKWAWKITATLNMGSGTEYPVLGIVPANNSDLSGPMRAGGTGEGYGADGRFFSASAGSNSSYGAAWSDGDVIEVGWDADNGRISFWHNGSAQGAARSGLTGRWKPAQDHYSTAGGDTLSDFGQSGYSPTDSSYKTLCTANLPTPSITDGSKYFQTTLYNGTGSELEVNQSGENSTFKPDFVWIKNRTNAGNEHDLYDLVRGATKAIFSSATNAENTQTQGLKSFDSDGFTVGTRGEVNTSGSTNVAWQWLANNTTGSTNDDGSVDSTVAVNTTAGFSIVKWVHTTSGNYTVGHGLGATPKMILVKTLDQGTNWGVYHSDIPVGNRLILNTTAAKGTGYWGANTWNSTVFSIGTARDANSSNAIAYVFAEIPGYSSIGSYEGNGSTDGTFVYTGFKPSFILTKNIDTTDQWGIRDAARNPFNVTDKLLNPNANSAETSASSGYIDILSNGFKARSSDSNINSSTLIYMAFAEHPFGGDGAAPATAR